MEQELIPEQTIQDETTNVIRQKTTITKPTIEVLKRLIANWWKSEYYKLTKVQSDWTSKIDKWFQKNLVMINLYNIYTWLRGVTIPENEREIYIKILKNIENYNLDITYEEPTDEEKVKVRKLFVKEVRKESEDLNATENVLRYNTLLIRKSELLSNILFHLQQNDVNTNAITDSNVEIEKVQIEINDIVLSDEEKQQSEDMIKIYNKSLNADQYTSFMLSNINNSKRYKISTK